MADDKVILRINAPVANIGNGQICCEDSNNAILGQRAWGGKDHLGNTSLWAALELPALFSDLTLDGPSTTGEVGILKHDASGVITGGQMTVAEFNTHISDGPIGASLWQRDADNFLYPKTSGDTVVVGDGDVTNPGVGFESSENTGWYYDSGLKLSVNGVQHARHTGSVAEYKTFNTSGGGSSLLELEANARQSGGGGASFLTLQALTTDADPTVDIEAVSNGTGTPEIHLRSGNATDTGNFYVRKDEFTADIPFVSNLTSAIHSLSKPASSSGAILTFNNFEATNQSELVKFYNNANNSSGYTLWFEGNVGKVENISPNLAWGHRLWTNESITLGKDQSGLTRSFLSARRYITNPDVKQSRAILRAENISDQADYAEIYAYARENSPGSGTYAAGLIANSTGGISFNPQSLLQFSDGYIFGSSWSSSIPLKLAASETEWNAMLALLGGTEGSLFALIAAAAVGGAAVTSLNSLTGDLTIVAGPASEPGILVGTSGSNVQLQVQDAPASEINFAAVNGSTYKDSQSYFDFMQGPCKLVATEGAITDGGGGAINVSAGNGIAKSADTPNADTKFFQWSAASSIVLTNNAVNYIFAIYDAVTPTVIASTNASLTDRLDYILLGFVKREDTDLDIRDLDACTDWIWRINRKSSIQNNFGPEYGTGIILSDAGTRQIAISAGTIFFGLDDAATVAFDSSGTDTFDTYYYGGAGWVKTAGQDTLSNTQYNNYGVGLASIGTSKWGVHWIYYDYSGDHCGVLYGTASYNSLSDAESSTEPANKPWQLIQWYYLIGRVIVQQGATESIEVTSVFIDPLGGGTSASTHNNLAGLQGGAVGEYYHVDATDYSDLTTNLPITTDNIVYGGSGGELSHSTRFTFDVDTDQVAIDKGHNATNWYDSDGAALWLSGTATQGIVIGSDEDLILGTRNTTAAENAELLLLCYNSVTGEDSDLFIQSLATGSAATAYAYLESEGQGDADAWIYINARTNDGTSPGDDCHIEIETLPTSGQTGYIDIVCDDLDLEAIRQALYKEQYDITVTTNSFEVNQNNGAWQRVTITANSTWGVRAPSSHLTKTFLEIYNSGGSDYTLTITDASMKDSTGTTGTCKVRWVDPLTDIFTIPAGQMVACVIYYKGETSSDPEWIISANTTTSEGFGE